jgi:putative transposase
MGADIVYNKYDFMSRGFAGSSPYKKPTTHTTSKPNQLWSWDITYLPSVVNGMHFYLYMIVDIFSRKIVGAEVHDSETGQHASELLQRSIWSEQCSGKGLVLHSDNGAPMKSFTMQAKMYDLGVQGSRSRPRVSNNNPYSESLFRTMKYCPQWSKGGFESLEEARDWVHTFVNWYNNQHKHRGIKFVTPNQKHTLEDIEILERRAKLYEAKKLQHPLRWSGVTRDWNPIHTVTLNPERETKAA